MLLPPLTSGELYALCGDRQPFLEGAEATWWDGMTRPGREAMRQLAIDLLLTRELLERSPGPDLPVAPGVAPGVALTLAARQDPAVMVACSRPDGETAWAPRLYGIAGDRVPLRAMVLEIVMDKVHRLFGPLHEFGLMSPEAAVRFLAWWALTPFREPFARKWPPRYVSIFHSGGAAGDGELSCDELEIAPALNGTLRVTLERADSGPAEGAEPVVCDPESLRRLFARLLAVAVREDPPGH